MYPEWRKRRFFELHLAWLVQGPKGYDLLFKINPYSLYATREEALEAARAWAAGALKMRPAQRAILNCHALAKELTRKEDIARCHGVGQACSVVHTPGHGLGYPLYDLTALVHQWGLEGCREAVEARLRAYETTLQTWSQRAETYPGPWAAFLQKR